MRGKNAKDRWKKMPALRSRALRSTLIRHTALQRGALLLCLTPSDRYPPRNSIQVPSPLGNSVGSKSSGSSELSHCVAGNTRNVCIKSAPCHHITRQGASLLTDKRTLATPCHVVLCQRETIRTTLGKFNSTTPSDKFSLDSSVRRFCVSFSSINNSLVPQPACSRSVGSCCGDNFKR